MAQHVCPWWFGYFLISPIRRWASDPPEEIVGPYLREGMTVLEPGPGMGFFTLPMARLVGPSGRIIVLDIQPRMLEGLRRRAAKAGLLDRIETRLVQPDSRALDDLHGSVDFVLAFAMVHELPSPERFFQELAPALKLGARLLLSEPIGHVKQDRFDREIEAAAAAGLQLAARPAIRRSLSALFVRPA